MATAYVSVRVVCNLFAVAVVCTCAITILPVSSSADEMSPSIDDFPGSATSNRGNSLGYASRVHQLQLMAAARRAGIAKLVPVIDRKLIVDEKRDDSSAGFDVDYGWGGGRFGKRRNGDALGLAGRFGRSVSVGGYEFDNDDERH